MTKEDEEGFVRCPDIILSGFLNGLITTSAAKMNLLLSWRWSVG